MYNQKLLRTLEDRFDKLQAYLFRSFDGEEDLYSFIAAVMYDKDYADCCEIGPDGKPNPYGHALRERAKEFILPIVVECGGVTEGSDEINNAPTVTPERSQDTEQQNKQDIKSCLYRSENSECELTNDDCFPDDIPWNCPFGKGGKE